LYNCTCSSNWWLKANQYQCFQFHSIITASKIYSLVGMFAEPAKLLAGSANMPTGLYILLAVISFFKLTKNISASTGLIFTIVYQMERTCVNFIDPDLFYDSLRTLPLQPIFDKFGELTVIQQAGVPN